MSTTQAASKDNNVKNKRKSAYLTTCIIIVSGFACLALELGIMAYVQVLVYDLPEEAVASGQTTKLAVPKRFESDVDLAIYYKSYLTYYGNHFKGEELKNTFGMFKDCLKNVYYTILDRDYVHQHCYHHTIKLNNILKTNVKDSTGNATSTKNQTIEAKPEAQKWIYVRYIFSL